MLGESVSGPCEVPCRIILSITPLPPFPYHLPASMFLPCAGGGNVSAPSFWAYWVGTDLKELTLPPLRPPNRVEVCFFPGSPWSTHQILEAGRKCWSPFTATGQVAWGWEWGSGWVRLWELRPRWDPLCFQRPHSDLQRPPSLLSRPSSLFSSQDLHVANPHWFLQREGSSLSFPGSFPFFSFPHSKCHSLFWRPPLSTPWHLL